MLFGSVEQIITIPNVEEYETIYLTALSNNQLMANVSGGLLRIFDLEKREELSGFQLFWNKFLSLFGLKKGLQPKVIGGDNLYFHIAPGWSFSYARWRVSTCVGCHNR